MISESSLSPLKDLASARFFPESSDGGEGGYEMGRREEGGGREGVWEAAVLEPVAAVEGGGWENGDEYHDFGDVISSQGEINRLQLELSKVKVECQHWRTLAKEKVHVHVHVHVHVYEHVLMRDERRKEERSKQDQTNNKAKQHSTHVHVHVHVHLAHSYTMFMYMYSVCDTLYFVYVYTPQQASMHVC